MKYIFRGVTVFEYDPNTKQVHCYESEYNGNHFNFCKFIPEDFKLISEFFRNAYLHARDLLHESSLADIEVN